MDAGDFALDEGLGVANAGQQAVVAGGGEGALADVFFGDEKACSGGLRSVLRAVGQQGLQALLNERCDVNHKAGAHVGVEAGVENLEGSMRWVGFPWGDDLGETADEAGFVA